MSKTFGKYIDEFEEVIFCEKHNKNDIYSGFNIKEKRPVSLKAFSKEKYLTIIYLLKILKRKNKW